MTDRQATQLRKLILRYKNRIELGKPWNRRKPDELWRTVLAQIAVPGNARAGYVIANSYEAKRQTALRRLKAFRTDRQRLHHLYWILRAVGSRYAGKSLKKDRQSKAALHNFHVLTTPGGPKRFFGRISKLRTETERIEALRQELKGYGPKSARDTAIELGLAKDCLALDIRLKKLLEAVGAQIKGISNRGAEMALVRKLGRRNLTGAQIDRILFQNYDKILADIKLAR